MLLYAKMYNVPMCYTFQLLCAIILSDWQYLKIIIKSPPHYNVNILSATKLSENFL